MLAAPGLAQAQSPTQIDIDIYGRIISTAEIYDPSQKCYTAHGQTGASTR